MKIVKRNKETDVVYLDNVCDSKIYVWISIGSGDAYKVHKIDDLYASVSLNNSNCLGYGKSRSLKEELEYPLNNNYDVLEFDNFKEMLEEMNKLIK